MALTLQFVYSVRLKILVISDILPGTLSALFRIPCSSFLWATSHWNRKMHHPLLKLDLRHAWRPQCDTSELWDEQQKEGSHVCIFAVYHAECTVWSKENVCEMGRKSTELSLVCTPPSHITEAKPVHKAAWATQRVTSQEKVLCAHLTILLRLAYSTAYLAALVLHAAALLAPTQSFHRSSCNPPFFFSCAFFALSMCVVIWERWCEGGSRWREAAHLMHTACSKESGDVYSHLLLIWLSERGFGKRSFHLFLVMWSTICQRKKSITSKHRKYILILYVPCMTLRYTSFFFGFLFFLFFFLSFSFCFRFKAGQL